MGIQASKQVGKSLLEACKSAEDKGKEQFDIDDPFIEALGKFWNELPAEFQSKINAAKHRAVQKVTRLESSGTLSSLVQGKLTDWSSNVDDFFKEDRIEQPRTGANMFRSILSCLFVLDHRTQLDDIRWRICTVVLFRVKRQICNACRLSQEDEQVLVDFSIKLGAQVSHQSQTRRWANIGEKYESLSRDLGGLGNLATLPSDGGRDLWESRLPKTGDPRKESIRLLRVKGTSRAAEAVWTTPAGDNCANNAVTTIVETVLTRVDAKGTIFVQQPLRIARFEEPKKERKRRRGQRVSATQEFGSQSKRKKRDEPLKRGGAASASSHGVAPTQSVLNANHVTATRNSATDKNSVGPDVSVPVRDAASEGNTTRNGEQECTNRGEMSQQERDPEPDPKGMHQMLEQDLARIYPGGVQQMLVQDIARGYPAGVQDLLQQDLDKLYLSSVQDTLDNDHAQGHQMGLQKRPDCDSTSLPLEGLERMLEEDLALSHSMGLRQMMGPNLTFPIHNV